MLDFLFMIIIFLAVIGFIIKYALIGADAVIYALCAIWDFIVWVFKFVRGDK